MPNINSLADFIRDNEGLLAAAERSPEIRDAIEPERLDVEQSLGVVKTLKARQEELGALRQETTQQLNAAVARTRDAAMRFRAIVKSKLGPRSERLVHFNVAPLRKRARKAGVKPPEGTSVESVA